MDPWVKPEGDALSLRRKDLRHWIPAFVGMTSDGNRDLLPWRLFGISLR